MGAINDQLNDKSSLFWGVNPISIAALLLATCALGFAPIFVRLCNDVGPSTIAFWRMILALPFLGMSWLFFPKPSAVLKTPNKRTITMLLLAGIAFAFDLIVWNYALTITSVANATLFVNFAPVFVAVIGWVLFRQRLPFRTLAGMALAIMGGIILVWPNFNTEQSTLYGDCLSLLAALFYAVYLIAVQEARIYFSTFAIMTLTSTITGITALIMVFMLGEHLMPGTAANWQVLFGIALIIQVIGQSSIAYALASLPAAISSIILLMQPAISAIAAMFIFDEHLVLMQWAGMVVVLIGILTTKLSKQV